MRSASTNATPRAPDPPSRHVPGSRRARPGRLDRTAGWWGLALAMLLLWSASAAEARAETTSCRASAARSSGPQGAEEPVVANPAATPCASESHELLGVASAGGMTVTDPRASTEAAMGMVSARASIDSAGLSDAPGIAVGHVAVTEAESCMNGIDVASGSSSVDGLTVGGRAVSIVGGQSTDQTIDGVRVRTNQLSGDTRQGLVLDVGGTEYVLGEAAAGGDACATLSGGAATEGATGAGATSSGAGALSSAVPGATASGMGAASGVMGGTLADRIAASQLALQCPRRSITLIDVLIHGGRVELLGAAAIGLVGRTVTIKLLANHKAVATAVVGSDGFFGATAPLPSRRLRFTNKASYQASIGTARSAYLKLTRRMLVQSVSSHAGEVTIRGQVRRPLAQPIATILIRRRLSCSSMTTVMRVKPRSNGVFTATLRAPAGVPAALYLATTRVRQSVHSRKTYPTSTLPRVVVIE